MLTLSIIKQMEQMAKETNDVVSLSQGVPFFPSDSKIRTQTIIDLMQNHVDKYTDPQGIKELRNLISLQLKRDGISYDDEEIIITAGAMEGLTAILLGLFNPNDEIIIPSPSYVSFHTAVRLTHLKPISIALNEDENWRLHTTSLKKIISKNTKAIILCNPNNPTGSVYDEKTLIEICEIALENNLYLILDEVYEKIVYGKPIYKPYRNNKYKKKIIRIASFSKTFSLTGWRVGYILSDTSTIKHILPAHDTIMNCAPVISQYAALHALKNEDRIVNEHQSYYLDELSHVARSLKSLSQYLDFQYPRGTYYFFPLIKGCVDSTALAMNILKKVKLSVVPGIAFGDGGEGHIRICFGRSTKDIKEGMKRLSIYFNEYYEQ